MTKAAELAKMGEVLTNSQIGGRRNIIINGAMEVAQRGTSSTSNGYATVDRFQFSVTNTDEFASTKTQEADGPDEFSNSFKVVATTAESAVAADERLRFIHFIEAQDLQQLGFGTASAKTTTLSFYVKSNVTGTYGFSMYQADSGRLIGGTYTINSANTWEQKTLTFSGDTSGSITNDNGQGFGMEWYLLAGSNYTGTDNTSWVAGSADKRAYGHTADWGETTNDYWQITGVQLEVGSQATPFEHRSFGEELALCQRYFQQFARDGNGVFRLVLSGNGGTNPLGGLQYKKTMRANPTFNYYGDNSDGGNFNVHTPSNGSTANTAPSAIIIGKSLARWNFTGPSAGGSDPHFIDCGTSTNQFSWTMDAEL